MNKQTKVWLVLSIALSLLALGSACGGGGNKDATPNTQYDRCRSRGLYSGPTGTITGVISFNGTPPAPKKIDTTADPVCGQKNPNLTTDDTIVKDGKLANVFVYIKEGTVEGGKKIGDYAWADADYRSPARSERLPLCAARAGRPGQSETQHHQQRRHAAQHSPDTKAESGMEPDAGQRRSRQSRRPLRAPEVLIPVKCNQHPWMKAYIGVMKHPFFAVSSDDGAFEIKGVPPGTYTVVAWREGGANGNEKTMQVTVPANGSAKADFAFGKARDQLNQVRRCR